MVFNSNRHGNAPSDPLSTALAELERGETAEIEEVMVVGPLGQRLADLGFLPGTRVTLVRRAPLGDPAVYELRGSQMCIRRSEAGAIRIRRVNGVATADTLPPSRP
jgi:Fe2+ transport system protein FeoA